MRRTRQYASHLASRAALHLDPFEQPGRKWILQQPASLIPGSENIVTNSRSALRA
jgi:hypothetical protein